MVWHQWPISERMFVTVPSFISSALRAGFEISAGFPVPRSRRMKRLLDVVGPLILHLSPKPRHANILVTSVKKKRCQRLNGIIEVYLSQLDSHLLLLIGINWLITDRLFCQSNCFMTELIGHCLTKRMPAWWTFLEDFPLFLAVENPDTLYTKAKSVQVVC